jgi:hypothetical protein
LFQPLLFHFFLALRPNDAIKLTSAGTLHSNQHQAMLRQLILVVRTQKEKNGSGSYSFLGLRAFQKFYFACIIKAGFRFVVEFIASLGFCRGFVISLRAFATSRMFIQIRPVALLSR